MAQFLAGKMRFDRDSIHLLTDARATTKTIKDRLEQLVGKAKAGDRILFHYSGHGAQYAERDASGDVSSIHDVICPVDFDWSPDRMIKDTDFASLFRSLPLGVEFNWISDSCHSGDLAREIELALNWAYRVPRLFPTPADMQWRIETAKSKDITPLGFGAPTEHLNGALLAGCASNQTSADAVFSSRYNGAFTFVLIKLLDSGSTKSPLNLLIKTAASQLSELHFSQVPQIRGNPAVAERAFLGTE